jgi:hypothetical protein
MTAHGRGRCRSCKARIVWALTATGRAMPVDAEPHPEGLLVLELGDTIRVRAANAEERTVVMPIFKSLRPEVKLFRSHFATCPNATEHRRKRPPRDGGHP